MNVVPLKQYDFDTWLRISAQNNALRAERCVDPWSNDDSWSLWQALFRQ